MVNIIVKGASAANNYSGESNRDPREKDPLQQALFAERMFQAASHNKQMVGDITGASKLEHIAWPTVQYYGYDHARNTSRLAAHIASYLGLSERDISIVKAAGLFHDIGRLEPWHKEDRDHAFRSASFAEEYMKKDPEWWAQRDLHEEICRLIAQHSLSGEAPRDPRAIALYDADCMEAARIAPNTIEGAKLMKQRMSQLQTEWARHSEHQQRWRTYRGWL